MLRKLALIISLFSPVALSAQVSISASSITDAMQHPIVSAKLCFAPVDASQKDTGFRVGSTQIVPGAVCGAVSGGVLQSGLTLAPNASGTYYHIWIANRTNVVIRDYGMTSITGSSWSMDTYDPNTASVPASTVTVGTVTPLPSGSTPTATITGSGPNYLLNLGIPQGQSGIGTDANCHTDGAGHLTCTTIAAGCTGFCPTFSPQHTLTYSPLFDTSGYLNLLKSLHGDFDITGTPLNSDTASPNYDASIPADTGMTAATPKTAGNRWMLEFPTPTSPNALTSAYGNGFISLVKASGSTTFNFMGDAWTNLGTNTAATPTNTAPIAISSASAATIGSAAGWTGSSVAAWQGQPTILTWTLFPSSSDYSSTRAWIGWCRGCSTSILNADATNGGSGPVLTGSFPGMAMLSYSTVRGDSVWNCVTTADGVTYTVTPITGATPSTTGTYKRITLGASSVTCTVGSNSVTVSTNVPTSNTANAQFWIANITQAAAAVNIRADGAYSYYQNRSN